MQPTTSRPTNVRWGVFALACGTSWLLYLHRYSFALMKPKIAEEWQLGTDELGLLDSAFSLSYTIFQVPLGVATDALGVHVILTGLIAIGAVGLGMHAWAGSSAQLWLARAMLGLGQSAVYAALSRLSRDWFPPGVRTTLQGIVGVTAGRIGGLSSYLLFGYLLMGAMDLDWRTATNIFVALGLVHGAIFFVFFRNTPAEHSWTNEAERALIAGDNPGEGSKPPQQRMTMRELFGRLTPAGIVNLVALNVQSVLSTFADNIYSNWIPLFLYQVYTMESKEIGIFSALPVLGGAVAGAVGGHLNDGCIAWTGNRRWSRSGVAFVGKATAAVLLFAALLWYDDPYIFCTMLLLVKLFGDWSLAAMWGVVTDIGGEASATVYAFNNTVAGIGSIVAPAVFGLLAKHYGWQVVFVTVAVTYVLCALSWLAINCDIPLIGKPRN